MQIMISMSIEANNSNKKLSILLKPIFNFTYQFNMNVLNNQHFHAVYYYLILMFFIVYL